MNADLMPGVFTIEYELAAVMGCEASALRAAATRLEQQGLVRVQPSGGFTVTALPVEHIVALTRQISFLEARAAYIAAFNVAAVKSTTPIGLSALSDSVLTMEDALHRCDPKRWAQAAHHFHRSLVQCSARPQLIATALSLSEPMHRLRMISIHLAGTAEDSATESRNLVEAIRSGAPARARDLHLDWWQRSTAAFLDLLKSHGMHELVAA